MKRITTLGILLIGVILLGAASTDAQDFSALLDAVEKIESNLKQLVEQEAEARTQDLARIRLELKAVKGQSSGDQSPQLGELAEAVKLLSEQVQALQTTAKPTAHENHEGSDEIAGLVAEVELLRNELQQLKHRGSHETGLKLASTDNEAAMQIAFGEHEPGGHDDIVPGLEITGFMDVVGTQQSSADDKVNYGLGQAEVDLTSDLSELASIEVAIAYNPDDAFFELGAAVIDIHPFAGSSTGHVRQEHGIDHTYLLAGMFDVPFGIDYEVYASSDRKLITAPEVVDLTHGQWNDIGFQVGLDLSYGNLVVFAVNGFESSAEVIDVAQSLATGTTVMEEIDTSPAQAFGGRIGFTLVNGLEFGGSFSTGINTDNQNEMTLIGADLQYGLSNFEIKGEYIHHAVNRSIAEEKNQGYYIQGLYDFGTVFAVSRYGSFKPYQAEWIGEFSIGVGYEVTSGVELRWETLVNENSENNANMIQMVTGF